MTTTAAATPRRSHLTRILLAVLFAASGLTIASTQTASALPPTCSMPIMTTVAGEGMAGEIDPPPSPLPPAGDPWKASDHTTIYEQYGYAGTVWYSYDLGCFSISPLPPMDTGFGNDLAGIGHVGVALTNEVHQRVADPAPTLAQLTAPVAEVSQRVNDAGYKPFVALALAAVALTIAYAASKGLVPVAFQATAWAFIVLTGVVSLTNYPVQSMTFADQQIMDVTGTVNTAMAGAPMSDPNAAKVAADGAANILVDMQYRQWLKGTLGSADSDVAKEFGPQLFKASTLNYHEAAQLDSDPKSGAKIITDKQTAWDDIAQKVKDRDPHAYTVLAGKGTTRLGTGAVTLLLDLLIAGFRLLADLIVLMALVAIPFLVVFAPVIGVLGIFYAMRGVAINYGKAFIACVVNSFVFAVAAGAHTLLLDGLIKANLPDWLVGLLAFLLTLVALGVTKPYRKVMALVSADKNIYEGAGDHFRGAGRGMRTLGLMAASLAAHRMSMPKGGKRGGGDTGPAAAMDDDAQGSGREWVDLSVPEKDSPGSAMEPRRQYEPEANWQRPVWDYEPAAAPSGVEHVPAARRAAQAHAAGERTVRYAEPGTTTDGPNWTVYDPETGRERTETFNVNDGWTIRGEATFVPEGSRENPRRAGSTPDYTGPNSPREPANLADDPQQRIYDPSTDRSPIAVGTPRPRALPAGPDTEPPTIDLRGSGTDH